MTGQINTKFFIRFYKLFAVPTMSHFTVFVSIRFKMENMFSTVFVDFKIAIHKAVCTNMYCIIRSVNKRLSFPCIN